MKHTGQEFVALFYKYWSQAFSIDDLIGQLYLTKICD